MSRLGHLGGRLYRGEVSIDFVGKQKLWYLISGLILVISIVSLSTLGLNRGIEFKGGSVFQFKAPTSTSTSDVRSTIKDAGVVHDDPIVQSTSTGWRVQTESLDSAGVAKVQQAVTQKYGLRSASDVAVQTVGASWGADVSKKAFQGLMIFMLLVVAYLWIAFEAKMALAAVIALAHDILITVGVYSLVQFEVTPGSVVGLLTILGYSLYDTVVVFDKVRENTRGLGPGSARTYSEAANLAVNQTLVRSINTSFIALLPVAGLLFIGAGLLQAGTLKDLSLVLFVGMIAGAYSSICIATPLLADFKEREPKMKALRARLAARESSPKRLARSRKRGEVAAEASSGGTLAGVAVDDEDADESEADKPASAGAPRKVIQRGPRQQPIRGSRRSRGKK
ncbi:protein translocase subunit SecF [Actinomadura alba]|uniref:protein translocase subunit SecF n=1 Tax=Actinomadura alba TaxID=406431 RepID=UPI0031D0F9D2